MQLAGKHTLNAPPSLVWNILMDPDILARIVPGITRLERISDNSFKAIVEIKMGPVSGSFTGNLLMEEIQEEKEFTLKVQQSSKIGNANAAIKISLVPTVESSTEVAFDGDVKLSGLLATMGQRVLGGVSNTLTKQFFTNMEKELAVKQSAV
jgi:carbon monoxide dehydrogenase subunit G